MPTSRPTRTRQSHPVDDLKSARGQSTTGPSYHANEGKVYESINPGTVKALPFNIMVYRNGVPEVHGFTARPVVDFGGALLAINGNDADAGQALLRMMRINLADDDGVSDTWSPVMTTRPADAPDNWVPKFRAPAAPWGDGRLYTMDKISDYADREKGSSRRRWNHLMFEDEGVVVSIQVVYDLLRDLTEAAAGVPTDGS